LVPNNYLTKGELVRIKLINITGVVKKIIKKEKITTTPNFQETQLAVI